MGKAAKKGMQSFGVKMLLFAALVAVSVFFGIDIATSGLERVHGPVNGAAAQPFGWTAGRSGAEPTATATATRPGAAQSGAAAGLRAQAAGQTAAASGRTAVASQHASSAVASRNASAAAQAAAPNAEKSFINRLSIKTGDALRFLAKTAIRFVAAAFETLLH